MIDPIPEGPHLAGGGERAESNTGAAGVARKRGVLVVDDDEDVRGVLAALLRRAGYAVWLAADGREGVALYLSHGPDIDAVLLDVRMPSPDGPRTLAALRQLNPRVRCCFMSGDLGTYSESELRELGAAGMLYKPFSLAEVAALLGQLANDDQPVAAAAEGAG
ncbi:MAG TPA: response regulator [Gemmataceae bacterium]|nr:response regulator [Gemmataceae bacterium]